MSRWNPVSLVAILATVMLFASTGSARAAAVSDYYRGLVWVTNPEVSPKFPDRISLGLTVVDENEKSATFSGAARFYLERFGTFEYQEYPLKRAVLDKASELLTLETGGEPGFVFHLRRNGPILSGKIFSLSLGEVGRVLFGDFKW